MLCAITPAMTSHTHHMVHALRRAGHPYDFVVHQKLLIGLRFVPAEQHLLKLAASHFNTLNMHIASQNVLERILIAMQNENEANCNENFRICSDDSVQAVDIIRPVRTELSKLQIFF